MSTSSSGSGATSHSTNPTIAKHQSVSPEGFLRPVEVPERVTKLVIYVGEDGAKIEEVLRACEGVNSVKPCMDLGLLRSGLLIGSEGFKYLIFNFSKDGTFSYIAEDWFYNKVIQKGRYYEVSYDLFIEKLKWVERALMFEKHVEELGKGWV